MAGPEESFNPLPFNLYLAPRLVRTARAAGVVSFGGNAKDFAGIHGLVAAEFPDSYNSSLTVDDLAFVLRWHGFNGDRRFANADPQKQYLRAERFATTELNRPDSWITKREVKDTDARIVELTIDSWRDPQFGRRCADALIAEAGGSLWLQHFGIFYEGYHPDASKRMGIRTVTALEFPHPISVLKIPKARA